MNKLLLIGPDSIHLWKFLALIKEALPNLAIITDNSGDAPVAGAAELGRVDFSLRRPAGFWRAVQQIRRSIAAWQPDIVHVHQANTSALATLMASRPFPVPVVVTAWGSDILHYGQQGWLYRRMVDYILRRASAFTADSLHLAGELRRLAGKRKLRVTVANFGIEIPHGEPGEKENMIYSNRLHKDLYRIDAILKQAARFFRSQPEPWRLVVGSRGPNTGDLKALAASLGLSEQVEFTGWVTEETKFDLYRRAKIYVSVPESDATSISLLEAMAAGCLPVVSNLPANREWILDGLNGVVAEELEQEFFTPALALDPGLAREINTRLIARKATLAVNRAKFLSLYQELTPNPVRPPQSAVTHA